MPEEATDADLAAHVADVCRELMSLSQDPGFRTLNGILDMARTEAERVAKNAEASGR